MPIPQELLQRLKDRYPKPKLDIEWLNECYAYVRDQLHTTSLEEAMGQVELQLLASDLRDSTTPRTGLPQNFTQIANSRLKGPFLVQIMALTDIGHSAFSLQNTRQIRMERDDMNQLAVEESDGEEEGPIPNYPRGMLRFELSDGSTVVPAIEYRKIPQIQLGVTPLGCKLVLSNFLVRKGMAFLEPGSVSIKGSLVEELDASRDLDFVRSLKRRLGQPEPTELPAAGNDANAPEPPPNPLENEMTEEPRVQVSQTNPQTPNENRNPVPRPPMQPGGSVPARNISESPYFANAGQTPAETVSSSVAVHLSNVSARGAQTLAQSPTAALDYSSDLDFRIRSDEVDEDFLAELDELEQKAYSQSQAQPVARHNSEVIDLDDSSDKENISFSQLPAGSQRWTPASASEVIDISD